MAGHKINSKKSAALLYTNDKGAEKEIRETPSFIIATNKIKYFGVTLTKQVKTYMIRTLSLGRKKLKKISENGKISHALG